MKKTLIGLLSAAALSVAGYFGYDYFQNNYLLLNQDDLVRLQINIQMYAAQAYEAGKVACQRTI